MRPFDELEFRDWGGVMVDCEPQDMDEPARAMTPPTAPFRWPLCAILQLRRMVQAATR